MNNNPMEVAFYTRDMMNAYNLRSKCKNLNIDVKYLIDLGKLILHVISVKKGVIFLDLKYVRFMKLISAFCEFRNKGEYIFVYLTDDKSTADIHDENSYVCEYSEIDDFLKNINTIIENTRLKNKQERDAIIQSSITNYLEEYNISPKLMGFGYLKDCINYAINHVSEDLYLNSNIYPIVAEKHGTTVENVEKNIRLAIKSATTNFPEIFDIDAFKDGKVTNRKFVSFVASKIEDEFAFDKKIC